MVPYCSHFSQPRSLYVCRNGLRGGSQSPHNVFKVELNLILRRVISITARSVRETKPAESASSNKFSSHLFREQVLRVEKNCYVKSWNSINIGKLIWRDFCFSRFIIVDVSSHKKGIFGRFPIHLDINSRFFELY